MMKKLEMQDTLDFSHGCIVLLVENSGIQVLREYSSEPARCWQRKLSGPSTPFAELVFTRSRVSGDERARIGLYSLSCGDLLVRREYFTNHHETGVIQRLDRLGMDGQVLGSCEVFSPLALEKEVRAQVDIYESGSAILFRLVDEQGRLLREQVLD